MSLRNPGGTSCVLAYAGNSTRATSKSPIMPTRIGFLPLYAFGAGQSYMLPPPQTPTLVDINLDGKADQMESTYTLVNGVSDESEIAFRYGDGSGGYTTVLTDHKSAFIRLIPSRLNGDDIADAYYLISLYRGYFPTCGAYLSTGVSSWSDRTPCGYAPIRTDLNGDGLDDFVNQGFGLPPSVSINRGGSFIVWLYSTLAR